MTNEDYLQDKIYQLEDEIAALKQELREAVYDAQAAYREGRDDGRAECSDERY